MEFKKKLIVQILLSSIAIDGISTANAIDLGSVSAGSNNGGMPSNALSAPYQAPSQGSLNASEPQSTISQHFIQNNIPSAGNYNDIAQVSPSVWNLSPNGAGGSDQGGLSLRGFQDGQYNVTFDGIPFCDGDDFTHHVNDYFMARDTGSMKITRGPGSAGTIGDATFGGTIAMNSKDPTADIAAITPYVAYGSFNSQLYGIEYDSGVMQKHNDASVIVDLKRYTSNGYLTNEHTSRNNLFVKYIQPINEDSALTFVLMVNQTRQHASPGATAQQIAQYGNNYGLNTNPNSQAYYGYNWDHFKTDFEYIDYQIQKNHWKLDNKAYTNSYTHYALAGVDPNGQTPNGTASGIAGISANGVPGVYGLTWYRSFGDVLRVVDSIGLSDLKFGIWVDHQNHNVWNQNADLTTGNWSLGNSGAYRSSDTSVQPYAEYVWRPTHNLTITPGVKYNSFTRNNNPVTSDIGTSPTNQTWTSILPTLTANYYLSRHWSVYGQVAKGFLPPQISAIQSQGTAQVTGQPKPDSTLNYQVGTAWKTRRLTLGGDVYYINESNFSQPVQNASGTVTYWQNAGGVDFKGIETEGTYYVGNGLSVYGNFSINGTVTNPQQPVIDNAPTNTAAASVIYNLWPVYASLMVKEIGPRYSGTDVNGNNISFGAYSITNASFSYHFGNYGMKHTTVRLQIDNLFNRSGAVMSPGNTGLNGYALYYTLPGRSVMLSLSTQL